MNKDSHTEVLPQSQHQDLPIDAHPAPKDATVPTISSNDPSVADLIVKEDLDIAVADNPDVYYLERNDVPGVCVKYPNKTASWTPIKISRS